MKVFKRDWIIDLEKSILWQYDKAQNLSNLIKAKQSWYRKNVSYFITNFYLNIFNIKTANDFGLSVWGKILNFPRQIVNKNDDSILNLSTEQYRFLLLGQVLKFKMNCTIPEINRYLRVIFNEPNNDNVYVIDNHNMTISYNIEPTSLSSEIETLIQNYDFLPAPAGVKVNTSIGNYNTLTINTSPTNAVVRFIIGDNEYTQHSIDVEPNTEVEYIVSASGFETTTGTITVTDDTTISVVLNTSITITTEPNTASISLTINGTTYTATGSITKQVVYGDTYSYTVSLSGYPDKSGSGTIEGVINETVYMIERVLLNITGITNSAQNFTTIAEITLEENCILDIDMVGGYGWENDYGKIAGGRLITSASFSEGDVIKVVKIKGNQKNTSNNCIGLALYLNDIIILAVGGAGFTDRDEDHLAVGGSGYQGGKAEGNFLISTTRTGVGIISGASSYRRIIDGSWSEHNGAYTYGGRGYVAEGYTNTATTRVKSLASIKIIEKY